MALAVVGALQSWPRGFCFSTPTRRWLVLQADFARNPNVKDPTNAARLSSNQSMVSRRWFTSSALLDEEARVSLSTTLARNRRADLPKRASDSQADAGTGRTLMAGSSINKQPRLPGGLQPYSRAALAVAQASPRRNGPLGVADNEESRVSHLRSDYKTDGQDAKSDLLHLVSKATGQLQNVKMQTGEEDNDGDDDDLAQSDGDDIGSGSIGGAAKSDQLQALVAAYGDWHASGANLQALGHSKAIRFVHMLRRTGRYDEAWELALMISRQPDFRMSLAFAAVVARLLRRSRNLDKGLTLYKCAWQDPPVSVLLRPLLRLALEPPITHSRLLTAVSLFKRMHEIRFVLSGDYSMVARALSDRGYMSEALDVFERMLAQRYYAEDYVDLTAHLIQESFRLWEPEHGWRLYTLACANGIPLATRALRTVIVLCLSQHNTDRALEAYTDMLSRLYARVNREPPSDLKSRTVIKLVECIDELALSLGRSKGRQRPSGLPQVEASTDRGPFRTTLCDDEGQRTGAGVAQLARSVPVTTGHLMLAWPEDARADVLRCTERGTETRSATAQRIVRTLGPPVAADKLEEGKTDLVYPVMYLMKIAASQGDPEQILHMQGRLAQWRLRADKAHHAALIGAYAAAGQLDQAKALLDAPRDPAVGFTPTSSLLGILIDEAIRHRDLKTAHDLAVRATSESSVTAFFFVRLIILFGASGHKEQAWTWYRKMQEKGWPLHDQRALAILGKPTTNRLVPLVASGVGSAECSGLPLSRRSLPGRASGGRLVDGQQAATRSRPASTALGKPQMVNRVQRDARLRESARSRYDR